MLNILTLTPWKLLNFNRLKLTSVQSAAAHLLVRWHLMWSQQHCRPSHWKETITCFQTTEQWNKGTIEDFNDKQWINAWCWRGLLQFSSLTHWACRSSPRRKPHRAACGCCVSRLLKAPRHLPESPNTFRRDRWLPLRTPPDRVVLRIQSQRLNWL